MARLILSFPEDQYCFTTQLTVRVTDINAANHLSNDSMISMISEARARFLFDFGVQEAATTAWASSSLTWPPPTRPRRTRATSCCSRWA